MDEGRIRQMSTNMNVIMNNEAMVNSIKKQRAIRVFVSSTFKDMKEERDELIKNTFLKLRKICEDRGVTWSEVDLRWGVTNEQSADGQVLPICLKEITNCNPFFIGILGERYGWIPEITPDLEKEYPWIMEHKGKSVTELEILQGALRLSSNKINGLFYFRDPKYIDTVKEEDRLNYIESIDDDEGKQLTELEIKQIMKEKKFKLDALKDTIRNSDYQVYENFLNAKELADIVYTDMLSIIDKLFPEDLHEDEVEKIRNEQEIYARSKTKFFVGRKKYLNDMSNYVAGDDSTPLIITGESGSGKSSLLSYWSLQHSWKSSTDNQEPPIIMRFIGAGSSSGDVSSLMSKILLELDRRFQLGIDIPHVTNFEKLREVFAQSLDMASEFGKLVIVMDSIDQLNLANDTETNLLWLPTQLPPNIRLILSTTKGPELQEFIDRNWTIVELNLLTERERKEIITNYFGKFGKNLEVNLVEFISSHPRSSNPLFLHTLLEEIRVDGDKGLNEKVLDYVNSKSIEDLFLKKMGRLEHDNREKKSNLVEDALSLLWGAKVGLSEAEITDLLGEKDKLSSSIWSPFYLALEDNLVSNSGFICLFHNFFRNAVEKKYLATKQKKKAIHKRLANYFYEKQDATANQERILKELPWQLAQAEEWKELYSLFQDYSFIHALWEYDPFMLKSYWASIEENTKSWKQNIFEELTMLKAYQSIIDDPSNFHIKDIQLVSNLLEEKYMDHALILQNYLRSYFEEKQQIDELLICLENISSLYIKKSDYHLAMKLLKEQEKIAFANNLDERKQSILGNQAEILIYWGYYEEAMPLLKEQERICQFVTYNKIGLQQSLGNQARIKFFQMKYDESLSLLANKELICRDTKYKSGLQEVIGIRGQIAKAQNQLDLAYELFSAQESICRSIGNMRDLQECLNNQAASLYELDRTNKAAVLSKLSEQEIICLYIKHNDGLQKNYNLQARLLQNETNYDSALQRLKSQEKICRDLDNKLALQECLGRQAFILKYKNQYEKALELTIEQQEICEKHGYLMGLQVALGNLSSIYRLFGKVYLALEYVSKQVEINKKLDNKRGLYNAYGAKAWMLIRIGDLESALSSSMKQEQMAIELDDINGYSKALYEQANIHVINGDYHQAQTLYQKCLEKTVDEKNANHVQLKLDKIQKIMDRESAVEDEYIVNYKTLNHLEAEILKQTVNMKQMIFEPLLSELNTKNANNVTKKQLQKILYVLKDKALVSSYKARKNGKLKTIYEITDLGIERINQYYGEDFSYLLENVHEEKEPSIVLTDEVLAAFKMAFPKHEITVDNKELPVLTMTVDTHRTFVIFIDKSNVENLSFYLEEINKTTKQFYIVAKEEQLLYKEGVIRFYQWLKQKYGKIQYANKEVEISIAYLKKLEEFEQHEHIWKKLKLVKND